jgi:hypothetical protein
LETRHLEHIFANNRINNKSKKRGGKMKNKLLKNIILIIAISSMITIPVFAENILPISAQDIIPINRYVFFNCSEYLIEFENSALI